MPTHQTPSAGLRHLSSNLCHHWLCHGSLKTAANRQFFICAFNSSRFVTTATNLIISGHVSLTTAHNLYASTNKTEIIQIQTKPKSFKSKQNPNHCQSQQHWKCFKGYNTEETAERWGSAHNICAFSNSWSSPKLMIILLRSKSHSPSPLSSQVLAAVCLEWMKHSTEKVDLTAPTCLQSDQYSEFNSG